MGLTWVRIDFKHRYFYHFTSLDSPVTRPLWGAAVNPPVFWATATLTKTDRIKFLEIQANKPSCALTVNFVKVILQTYLIILTRNFPKTFSVNCNLPYLCWMG